MFKIYALMFLLCIFATTFSQTPVNKISGTLETKISNASATDEILVWIYFIDKGMNTDIYFSNPKLVVSEKSIKRREKVLLQEIVRILDRFNEEARQLIFANGAYLLRATLSKPCTKASSA